MRKDVERTFGILKGRWRILKTGIRLQSLIAVDDVCLTCCALHNMLLNIDGLDVKRNEGVKSLYEGEMGWHKNGLVEQHISLIFARVNRGLNYRREFDESLSHELPQIAYGDMNISDELILSDVVDSIREMSFKSFRSALIVHFHEKWLRNEIVWPSLTGVVEVI